MLVVVIALLSLTLAQPVPNVTIDWNAVLATSRTTTTLQVFTRQFMLGLRFFACKQQWHGMAVDENRLFTSQSHSKTCIF